MKLSAILAPMIAAGVSGDVILATVRAFEDEQGGEGEAAAAKREADAERSARRRERMDVSEGEWCGLRNLVLGRDGHVCAYCSDEQGPFHVDHIVPVARGGKSTLDNLCVACRACNCSKSDKTLDEWRGRYQ